MREPYSSFKFLLDGTTHALNIAERRPDLTLTVDGRPHQVSEAGALGDDCFLLTVDGVSYQVWRVWEGNRIHLKIGQRSISVGYEDAITAAQQEAGGGDILKAEMPGVVVSIDKQPGDPVLSGDIIMVIESMKMQINIIAPRDGVLEKVCVAVNEAFDKGAELAALVPLPPADD